MFCLNPIHRHTSASSGSDLFIIASVATTHYSRPHPRLSKGCRVASKSSRGEHICWSCSSRPSLPSIRPLTVAWALRGRPSCTRTAFTTRAQPSSARVSVEGAGRTGMAVCRSPVPPRAHPAASRHLRRPCRRSSRRPLQPRPPHRLHPRRHACRATALWLAR